MIEQFEFVMSKLIGVEKKDKDILPICYPLDQFNEERTDTAGIIQSLNAAFLASLTGKKEPIYERTNKFLLRMIQLPEWRGMAEFYRNGLKLIHEELERGIVCKHTPDFADKLEALVEWLSSKENFEDTEEKIDKIWSVFCPEATGIRANKEARIKEIRDKRAVTITKMNPFPIVDPARQMLFTSNILLTIPTEEQSRSKLHVSDGIKKEIYRIAREPQLHWYDHPIQIGCDPETNEIFHGLRGLQEAFDFERSQGNASDDTKLTCLLSVSVTHEGLQKVARPYIEEEFLSNGELKNINVYIFTEADSKKMIDEVLIPAAEKYLFRNDADELFSVFGVDGEYGRHFSFLKAITALWNIFIDQGKTATFKIDLDQVFPQKELLAQTGATAFEHLMSPLWGAHGVDVRGNRIELGMMAGALVNDYDIQKSLFTSDVPFPERHLSPDEYIFFSTLPQAVSTEAEMMTKYDTDGLPDGEKTCIQRIHVTGGTSGILIDSLRHHGTFTPSFIGRAEDQAYLLSVFPNPKKLAYLHKDGLIMRHDKESFAQQAIQTASGGKIIGDYIRTLLFTAYARVLTGDIMKLKYTVDPFTGCFISGIPITIVFLRFSLKAVSFFSEGKNKEGVEFIMSGVKRLMDAIEFISGEDSKLKQQYERERRGWNLFYDTLFVIEDSLENEEKFAEELKEKFKNIIEQCSICINTHPVVNKIAQVNL